MEQHPTYFRLIAIDDHSLPVRLRIGGADYVVQDGEFELDEEPRIDGDGAVRWRLFGEWPDGRRDMAFSQHEPYRRLDSTRVEFSVRPSRIPEYVATTAGDELVLSSHTRSERSGAPARVFGADHTWRFVASVERIRRPTAATY